jgi:hypothetical protein
MAAPPVPNRPPGLAVPRPPRRLGWLLALLAVLAAGVLGWVLHGSRTVTRTRLVAQPPATIYQHTPAGAVAAVQGALAQIGSRPPIRPARGTTPGPGQVNSTWHLLYRVISYSPAQAVIQTWSFSLAAGYGYTAQDWSLNDTGVTWRDGRWVSDRQPTTVADATPPAMNTTGTRDQSFGALLSRFRRFPGAP